jgi:hypothetical protein
MVRRGTKDDGGTAVIEATGNPSDIAARVEQAAVEARRDEVRADVLRWREIVNGVAAGREPSAADIRDIGAIAHRLRLPSDSVAIATHALKRADELDADTERFKKECADVQARKPELVAEIKAVEQRLLDLRATLNLAIVSQSSIAATLSAANHHRNQHPLVFGNVEHVVNEVCRQDLAMGRSTLDGLKHRPQLAEGKTLASWST